MCNSVEIAHPLFSLLLCSQEFAISLVSSALEEVSVRANLALAQKKFVNEVTAVDVAEKEELDAEYGSLCAQVVGCRNDVRCIC